MFDGLFKRIDDILNPKDQIKKTDYTLFENKMARSFGIVTESLDSFINIIERPANKENGPIFDYLKTATPNEIDDWVNALEIAIVEHETINRWALSLVEKTEQELELSHPQRIVIAGIKEALGIASWSEQGQFCSLCNEEGHNDQNCPYPRCARCGYAGHTEANCEA